FDNTLISVGTGFIVNSNTGKPFLITNRHNLTGKHNETGDFLSPTTAAVPNKIEIYHNKLGERGTHIIKIEEILTEDIDPKWIEHPKWGSKADFVALPLTELDDVAVYAYHLNMGSEILL